MKNSFKKTAASISLIALWMIFWILGLMVAGLFFPASIPEQAPDGNENMMLLVISLLNASALMIFIHRSLLSGWRLVLVLFATAFGLQYLLSQIETLWFNDSLKMAPSLILMVVTGGAISTFLWAVTATKLTGRFGKDLPKYVFQLSGKRSMLRWVAIHAAVTWPAIYFLAGYFIAWQFPAVRQYYSGSEAMDSFATMMQANFASGLYLFQVLRGIIWILIAFLILFSLRGNTLQKAIICGMLFSVISSSQLLLPNPIMPEDVRIGHLLETGSSNFLWGIILGFAFCKYINFKKAEA